jgi:hypothetical protein
LPLSMPTFSIPRPSKIYPNWDIWNQNIPSGNPGMGRKVFWFSESRLSSSGCVQGLVIWPSNRFGKVEGKHFKAPILNLYNVGTFICIYYVQGDQMR